jgi:predicted transcriptional regulator of viral defense system
MQPIQTLKEALESLADGEHYFFRVSDFYQLFPGMRAEALLVLLGRAVKAGVLQRFCRGLYLYPKVKRRRGYELYHAAARLREESFCYLSLESVLSEEGVISQVPLAWITVMTGGRSGIIPCGAWGSIEYIHTKKRFQDLETLLIYDNRYCLWRAPVRLALKDMRAARRSMDLVNMEAAHEFF